MTSFLRIALLTGVAALSVSASVSAAVTEGDQCTVPTVTPQAIPGGGLVFNGSTLNQTDDYQLDSGSTCNGEAPRAGNTSIGPDYVYAFRTDSTCDLSVFLSGSGIDLALYALGGSCPSLPATASSACIDLSDSPGINNFESIGFTANPGTTYYLVADSGAANAAGGFTLTIFAISGMCSLVPVELQGFTIE